MAGRYQMIRGVLLWALGLGLVRVVARTHANIALIIDEKTVIAAYTLVHSILKKATTLNRDYAFYVVTLEDREFDRHNGTDVTVKGTLANMWEGYMSCYSKLKGFIFKTVPFKGMHPALSGVCEGQLHICARFYLPVLLGPYSVNRFIYVDNDAILTADIADLYEVEVIPLPLWKETPDVAEFASKAVELRKANMLGKVDPNTLQPKIIGRFNYPHPRGRRPTSRRLRATSSPGAAPIVSFVWEHHPAYKMYLESHFNGSDLHVKRRLQGRGNTLFFNAGVAVVDADAWRRQNVTGWVEGLLLSNVADKGNEQKQNWNKFDFEGSGDQGVFYMAPEAWLGAIPEARWNMRRLPKKTINLLTLGKTGIVHFAGMRGSNLDTLCMTAYEHPLLVTTGAINLLMDVAKSAKKTCKTPPTIPESCLF